MHLVHFPCPSHSSSQVHHEHTVPGGPCISSGELSQARTLLADMKRSGSQEYMVSNWHPAHSLAGDLSGVEIAAPLTFPLFRALASLHPERAVNGSQLAFLWYLLGHNPLFCECARRYTVVPEPFCWKGPLFFFVSLAFPRFELLCHVTPLSVSSGHSISVLTLRTNDAAHASAPSPHSLWADMSI